MLQEIAATCVNVSVFTSIFTESRYSLILSKPLYTPSRRTREAESLNLVEFIVLSKDSASTVAVVVPSPASFTVFLAASLINVAPMFSTGSYNTTLSATVTPSLVITGFPSASS